MELCPGSRWRARAPSLPHMLRRPLALVALLATGCASNSTYAIYAPAQAGPEASRIERSDFSIVPPLGWEVVDSEDNARLKLREQPPDNGRNRLYRILDVELAPEASDSDGQNLLRQRHAKDDLEVRSAGTTQLAGRDCQFLVGRKRGPAADLFFDVLDYYVPGKNHGLIVSFLLPDGQLAASRSALEQTASTLHTSLGMPGGVLGTMQWHADHNFGLRLPAEWEAQADTQGALAMYLSKEGSARCDVIAQTFANACDLDRLFANYEQDRTKLWGEVSVLQTEWRHVGDLRALRFVSVYQDADGPIVTDDLFVAHGNTMYNVLFRAPQAEYAALHTAIGNSLASVRVE
jgi:hypothetical protein